MAKKKVEKKVDFRDRPRIAGKCYSLSRSQAVDIYGAENVSVDYEPEFPVKGRKVKKS